MNTLPTQDAIDKLATGIPGFDLIARGGLPAGRSTLVSGTSGSAKTVFGAQFLAEGARIGQSGVFVTFEEPPADIRRNMLGFDWDIAGWEAQGRWAFVDVSPEPGQEQFISGSYDLGALLARIENAVRRLGAKRVVLDSLGGIFAQVGDTTVVRNEVFRVAAALKRLGVTSVITAERVAENGSISRHGVEEFVADNVVVLRNSLEFEKRRRTIEILKFRGTSHQKSEFPFTIVPGQGIVVLPLSAIVLEQKSTDVRITSGNAELDQMCGGGFYRDSIILVSGPTGTGKTLITTEFIAGGARSGERCLLCAFEESREQLFRNAIGWGVDFSKMEADGNLRVVSEFPEAMGLEDHLINLKDHVEQFQPQRIAVDSLSALERVSSDKSFREFVLGLTSYVKDRGITVIFTATTTSLTGGASASESHLSTLTDSIILLRYVEVYGEMRRGLTVLKMRGSSHDKNIREFTIDHQGMHIGRPFRNAVGILSGAAQSRPEVGEIERIDRLFRAGSEEAASE